MHIRVHRDYKAFSRSELQARKNPSLEREGWSKISPLVKNLLALLLSEGKTVFFNEMAFGISVTSQGRAHTEKPQTELHDFCCCLFYFIIICLLVFVFDKLYEWVKIYRKIWEYLIVANKYDQNILH